MKRVFYLTFECSASWLNSRWPLECSRMRQLVFSLNKMWSTSGCIMRGLSRTLGTEPSDLKQLKCDDGAWKLNIAMFIGVVIKLFSGAWYLWRMWMKEWRCEVSRRWSVWNMKFQSASKSTQIEFLHAASFQQSLVALAIFEFYGFWLRVNWRSHALIDSTEQKQLLSICAA